MPIKNLEPKHVILCFFRQPSVRSVQRAFNVHLRQCLLGIGGYLQFDAPPRRLAGQSLPPIQLLNRKLMGKRSNQLSNKKPANSAAIKKHQQSKIMQSRCRCQIWGPASQRNFRQPSVRSVRLSLARFWCPRTAWRWRIPSVWRSSLSYPKKLN